MSAFLGVRGCRVSATYLEAKVVFHVDGYL